MAPAMAGAVQGFSGQVGQGDPEVVRLTGVYNNLLRLWADT
jgi:PKHD-type hydroxylase